MSKSKWPIVKENLLYIEKSLRDGATEKQVYNNLRVGKTAWEGYKKKYPELQDAIKRGNAPFLNEIFGALKKRALGYEYKEEKTYIRQEDGKKVSYQEITKKHQPPDTAACFIILKNKDKDEKGKSRWSNDPAKIENDRELLELRKQVEEMKLF